MFKSISNQNRFFCLIALALAICFQTIDCIEQWEANELFAPSKEDNPTNAKCSACRDVARSFLSGMENTSTNGFDGGNVNWLQDKNIKYKDSELRLTEIQEKLCEDIYTGRYVCQEFGQDNAELIEKWWFDNRLKDEKLVDFLCVDQLKICCPDDHAGPECKPCPGYPDKVCSGHGKCRGNGKLYVKGDCDCDQGYTGPVCDTCSRRFLKVGDECKKCDSSCADECTSLGPTGCVECRHGYYRDETLGCQDVNECLPQDKNPCLGATLCVNTQGSYECMRKFFGLLEFSSQEETSYKKCCQKHCR